MASKISEQERRNVWISVYSGVLVGLATSTEEFNEDTEEENREIATAYADGGLDDFLTAFGEAPVEVEEEEEEVKPTRSRRRRAS